MKTKNDRMDQRLLSSHSSLILVTSALTILCNATYSFLPAAGMLSVLSTLLICLFVILSPFAALAAIRRRNLAAGIVALFPLPSALFSAVIGLIWQGPLGAVAMLFIGSGLACYSAASSPLGLIPAIAAIVVLASAAAKPSVWKPAPFVYISEPNA